MSETAPLDPLRLPPGADADAILNAFLEYLTEAGIQPYPHQEEAILELFQGRNVILDTPTGSGKPLVALALQYKTLCEGRRSYYTVPIKALAHEKFLAFCRVFGAEHVGLNTGLIEAAGRTIDATMRHCERLGGLYSRYDDGLLATRAHRLAAGELGLDLELLTAGAREGDHGTSPWRGRAARCEANHNGSIMSFDDP